MSAPSIARANLPGSGAARITINSVNIWTRADVVVPLVHTLVEQVSSMYGRVTKTRGERAVTLNIPIYGFWTNLSTIMPAALLNPTIGTRLFGTSDQTMTLLARNGDRIIFKNCQITKMANLKLAANAQIFTADATFTCLVANNTAVTTANAWYTISTGNSYSTASDDFDTQAASYFRSLTWTGAWGSRTGFTTILTQEGWTVDWEIKTTPDKVDGIGIVDMFIDLTWGKASCIPVGPTLAQLDGGLDFQYTGANTAANANIGADMSQDSDNLVITDSSVNANTFTLFAAAMTESGLVFAPGKKRIRSTSWEGTLTFTSHAPNAMAAVS